MKIFNSRVFSPFEQRLDPPPDGLCAATNRPSTDCGRPLPTPPESELIMSDLPIRQPGLQPLLHDLNICLSAPTVVLAGSDGQIRAIGAHGIFAADLRVLAMAVVRIDGREPEAVAVNDFGSDQSEFVAVFRETDDPNPDPTLWLRRRRSVSGSGVEETLTFENAGMRDRRLTVELEIASDLADIEAVKSGRGGELIRPTRDGTGLRYRTPQVEIQVHAADGLTDTAGTSGFFRWEITVPARSIARRGWSLGVTDTGAAVAPAPAAQLFSTPAIQSPDRRLAPLVTRAIDDLQALRLCSVQTPDQSFIGAGAPWYLTLFGRDSIWAARMLLPLGTGPALGTLRTLAAFQGTVVDPETAEEPGKIPHEVRRPHSSLASTFLPPVYYGTVDATPLWVCLLHDAWRWGAARQDIEALLPAAEAALRWMREFGDSDGDGFLEYIDTSGRGLTNQGWKDSGDSVRFRDGRIARGPVALAEVQGYAYQAAINGAALLEAFERPGAEEWLSYAAELKILFQQRFWVHDELGRYPALALDGEKNPVDAPTSNMGHLLGTGILAAQEAADIADRLVHPTLSSGFGLRTMGTNTGGYSPLSYHCGSVWPHDTAIAIGGLVDEGFTEHAAVLTEGLLAAGFAFNGRLPELYGGFDSIEMPHPVPYPASCRPQAWSAAAAVVLLRSQLGLAVDVPAGIILAAPARDAGALQVDGLQVAGHVFGLAVAGADISVVGNLPAGMQLTPVPALGISTPLVERR